MQIREATEQDIPGIIDLLKLSLGESLLPKSEAYWYWKHINNPFGPSPVLLAEEAGQLVGVRAFMRWGWENGSEKYSALRAVDTATHPDFRGKGTFKKLTLALVEQCREAGDNFIFNTPNDLSRPGYLKMGWKALGKLPVRLKIRRPLHLAKQKLSSTVQTNYKPIIDYGNYSVKGALDKLEENNWLDKIRLPNLLQTPHTLNFLRWRYEWCPIQDYAAISENGFLMIFYIRDHNFGRELRLNSLFIQNENKYKPKELSKLCQNLDIDFISTAPAKTPSARIWLRRNLFLPSLKIGPILTFRSLSLPSETLPELNSFAYQIGDLELF